MNPTLCECWLRDGLQAWPALVPIEDKLRVAEAVLDAGVSELDVTSFVPPTITRQFEDGHEVLARLAARASPPSMRVLAVNLRSVDRIAALGDLVAAIDWCGMPISASDAHNRANLGRSTSDQRAIAEGMIRAVRDVGVEPLVCVASAFGCTLQGPVPEIDVILLVDWAARLGVRRLMISDTTGMADPDHVSRLYARVRAAWPDLDLVAHFHDGRGSGIANTLAAVAAGATVVDASLGGAGGEPPSVDIAQVGDTGNVCTEDLAALLARGGRLPGIDVAALLEAGALAERAMGARLHSRVQRAGLPAPVA